MSATVGRASAGATRAPDPAIRLPVRIVATGAHLPERIVGNAEIAAACGVDPAWILRRTGFVERRRAAPETGTTDLATQAAEDALAAAPPAEAPDLVLVATCSPDQLFPSTAAQVAARIGAAGAAAFDLQAGCAGFAYAFTLAAQSLATGLARRAVVVGADTMSRLVDPADAQTAPIFGDGAAAAVLEAGDGEGGIEAVALGSDGRLGDLLRLDSRVALPTAHGAEAARHLAMQGPQLFRRALRLSVAAAHRALDDVGLAAADVDLLVPHQSSKRLLEATARELAVPRERVVTNYERWGNTSCASLPLALHDATRAGDLPRGRRALLLGFGAGLSWGAVLLRS